MFIHQVPSIIPSILPNLPWSRLDSPESRKVYFTFDDGQTPEITKFVLDCLADYQAKATFFCIGKNMLAYPQIVQDLVYAGHRLGNHTMNHANAWRYSTGDYHTDYLACEAVFKDMQIESVGFRPPYGRVTPFIYNSLTSKADVFMWSVLTGDYNSDLDSEDIVSACTKLIKPGSIIVFHDSEKAFPRLKVVLPLMLEYCLNQHLIPCSL